MELLSEEVQEAFEQSEAKLVAKAPLVRERLSRLEAPDMKRTEAGQA